MIVKNKALGGIPSEAQEKVNKLLPNIFSRMSYTECEHKNWHICNEQVLQCALVTYDLMESLVIRIEEILEEKVWPDPYHLSFFSFFLR